MSYADIRSKKKTSSKLISDGMNQIHTDEIVGQILTVLDVDVMNARNGRCGVMSFAEYPNGFYFAGKVLTEDPDTQMYVLSNEQNVNGASQILNQKVMDEIAENWVVTLLYFQAACMKQ